MEKIEIYVSCHKNFYVPAHPLLVPVQVGAALARERFPGMESDAEGENISAMNPFYCELTAQYWAWKNRAADWYGFYHYRRYLSFRADQRRAPGGAHGFPVPYTVCRRPTPELLKREGYEEANMRAVLAGGDIVAPLPEEMHVTVYEHYRAAPYHHIQDLDLAAEILRERSPGFADAANVYLSNTRHYFGNLYLMRRDLFYDYCAWLFPLLAEFDRRKNVAGYTPQELRVDGYLAERLLGVYVTGRMQDMKVVWLPRLHFACMEGSGRYAAKKLETILLPPGTRRRSAVKRLAQGKRTAPVSQK